MLQGLTLASLYHWARWPSYISINIVHWTLESTYDTKIKIDFLSPHACMPSHFSCVWLFATTDSCQTPLSIGFSRQEYWSGSPCLPPGGLPDPGIESVSLKSPALNRRIFTTRATWDDQLISCEQLAVSRIDICLLKKKNTQKRKSVLCTLFFPAIVNKVILDVEC